ncbi:MAG: GIY-YIG nuclease family protein [Rhizonema sp. NSF051]|nr:GIY-YIG nuclease family protein [Rhizonema sp. NSF051]
MINPSDIKLETLPWLPLEEKSAFPKRSSIYFAIDSLGSIQYIGRTINVRTRWGNHHKYNELNAIGNIKIAYLFVDLPELLPEIERALIEYFQPSLNIGIRNISKFRLLQKNKSENILKQKVAIKAESFKRILQKRPKIGQVKIWN